MTDSIVAFNPYPRIQLVTFGAGVRCFVVDDALQDPERLVRHAVANRAALQPAAVNAYPGLEFNTAGPVSDALSDFFQREIRGLLGARRILRMYSRLSLLTVPPARLQARQSICHCDNQGVDPDHIVAASLLYLFRDESLGGTSFFVPKKPAHVISQLLHDASTMTREAFRRRHGIAPGYCTASNEYFELAGTVPARWNRIIFYDGGIFHSAAIAAPEKLTDDPRTGRLTHNGFFDCTRKAR